MRRFIVPLLLVGFLGMLPHPEPADAQSKLVSCMREAIGSCNEDFPGQDHITVAIRGWCYQIRTAICWALDKG